MNPRAASSFASCATLFLSPEAVREQHRRRRRLGRRVEREIDLDPLVAPGPVDDVEQGLARRCRLGNRRPPFAAGEQEDTEPEKGDKDHCRKDEALAAPGGGGHEADTR